MVPARKKVSLQPPTSPVENLSSEWQGQNNVLGETDEDIQAREDDDSLNEVIMAIDFRDKYAIGCAYYIAREEKLCMMNDMKMGDTDIVDILKLYAAPTLVLISSRADERLETRLSREAHGLNEGDKQIFLTTIP